MLDPGAANPTLDPDKVSEYLSRTLGRPVRLLQAAPLTQSSRTAPWRLDAALDSEVRSFVLRIGAPRLEHEYHALCAMQGTPVPAPLAYGLNPGGTALGLPCFFYDFVEGDSLLTPMLAGETWAEELYLDTVIALQSITREQLQPRGALQLEEVTALDILEDAYASLQERPHLLAVEVYNRLVATQPRLPALRFSNGDLWPDNLIIRSRQLVGVIDFEHAGFSDPFFEFLLPFFVAPQLRGRGIEERYCARMGFDPAWLDWYHGLEYFETWSWTRRTGKAFNQYTAQVLESTLLDWLAQPPPRT